MQDGKPCFRQYLALHRGNRAPEGQHKEISANPSASSRTQFQCLSANSSSMGNTREESGMCACLHDSDAIGITGTQWNDSHDWSVAMEGYRLFRKDRQGRWWDSVCTLCQCSMGVHEALPGEGWVNQEFTGQDQRKGRDRWHFSKCLMQAVPPGSPSEGFWVCIARFWELRGYRDNRWKILIKITYCSV